MRFLCLFWILRFSLAAREISDTDVIVPGTASADACKEHCNSLTGCRDWSFEESGCVVILSPHVLVQGVSADGISLLQTGTNCSMTRDPTCGWQVDTYTYGGCTLDRVRPDQCMGYCSDGCVYIQDSCEASCQPLITVELSLDVGRKKLKLLQACPPNFETDVRDELMLLWGIADESYIQVTADCSGSPLIVIATIVPHATFTPTTDLLASLADAVYNSLPAVDYNYLSTVILVDCLENCDVCVGYCASGVAVGESCTEDVSDMCGGICPDMCEGFGKCYQEQCHPALLDDVIACEPMMKACADSPDEKCKDFIIKFLNGTCIDVDNKPESPDQVNFAACYDGDLGDQGYARGVAVLMCYGAIVMESNCSPIVDCLPQHWSCEQDPTGGCIALNEALLFDQTCDPAYTGPALRDCYLSLNANFTEDDNSLRLATEMLTCVQYACWDECDAIGALRDPTRQVCLTPCEGAACVETLEGVLAAGVQCDVSGSPPCSLVKGTTFSVNYYQKEGDEGTLCQTIENTGSVDDSFFVWGTQFDMGNNGAQHGKTCAIVDAADGTPPTYLGISLRAFTLDPSNFHHVATRAVVEECVDLFRYYDLLNDHEYTLMCPSRVMSYIDVITLHTNGAGFEGPTEQLSFTTGTSVDLLSMQPRARLQDLENHDFVLNEVRLLDDCRPDGFSGCNDEQKAKINDEYHDACNTVRSSSLFDTGDPGGNWAKKYFKDNDGMSEISNGLQAIEQLLVSGSKVSCGGDCCSSNTYAYVFSEDTTDHYIYLCDVYWQKGGERTVTLVHEAGHFVDTADLDDVKYGCENCLDLGSSDMKRNADNWGFYVDDFCEDDCFSPSAIVTTKTRGEIEIKDLKIGDQVLAIDNKGDLFFDDIYFLAHFHPLVGSERFSNMLHFVFSNRGFIDVSPGHLVYLQNQGDSVIGEQHCMTLPEGQEVCTYQAWEAVVGSTIFVNIGMELQPRLIEEITRTREKIRNIYTLGGNALVDNVLVSCYEKNYATIHSEMWMLRFLYQNNPFLYKTFYPFIYVPLEFFTQRFVALTGSLNVVTYVAEILLLLVLVKLKGYLRKMKKE